MLALIKGTLDTSCPNLTLIYPFDDTAARFCPDRSLAALLVLPTLALRPVTEKIKRTRESGVTLTQQAHH